MPSSSWRVVVDARAAQDLKQLRRRHHPMLSPLIRAIESLPTQPYALVRVGDRKEVYR